MSPTLDSRERGTERPQRCSFLSAVDSTFSLDGLFAVESAAASASKSPWYTKGMMAESDGLLAVLIHGHSQGKGDAKKSKKKLGKYILRAGHAGCRGEWTPTTVLLSTYQKPTNLLSALRADQAGPPQDSRSWALLPPWSVQASRKDGPRLEEKDLLPPLHLHMYGPGLPAALVLSSWDLGLDLYYLLRRRAKRLVMR